jgi:hypothetical protein
MQIAQSIWHKTQPQISGWSGETIAKRFKPANCIICGEKPGFLNRHPLVETICLQCLIKVPKRLQKEIANAARENRYDDLDYLLNCAQNRDIGYWTMKYLGGHPNYSTDREVSLRDREREIIVFEPENGRIGEEQVLFTMDWKKIAAISADPKPMLDYPPGFAATSLPPERSDLERTGCFSHLDEPACFLNIVYNDSLQKNTVSFMGDPSREMADRLVHRMHK